MMMSGFFGESLVDELMSFPFERDYYVRNPLYGVKAKEFMKTDVKELEDSYEIDIDLPGFKKEDVNAQLKDGYLTITASTSTSNDEKDNNGKYIRQERFVGNCARSFYVGKEVKQEEIHAKFEDGILKLSIPRKDAKSVAQKSFIPIEG